MQLSLTNTLPLLCTLLPHTTARQSTNANGCSTFEPTSAFQIYSASPDLTTDLSIPTFANASTGATNGTRRTHKAIRSKSISRRSAHIPFTFYVAQDANNTNRQDLVVSFSGLPCDGPGPFSFEFNFAPQSAYVAEGQAQINIFRVDSSPLGDGPTWNSIAPLTGGLVGTFTLPAAGSDQPALLYLNQLVCRNELVLRFGIAQSSTKEGVVAYINSGGMGLRERSGC